MWSKTPTTYGDIAASFGERVADIVRENSDNMSLPKSERRRARIAAMSLKSREARIVKIADVISNLRAIAVSPPAGWSVERKLGYLEGCRQLVDAGRGTEASIQRIFDETAADVERAIRDDARFFIDGREVEARHLDSEIGQAVHLVYLPNTGAALSKPPMWTAYASSSGIDSRGYNSARRGNLRGRETIDFHGPY